MNGEGTNCAFRRTPYSISQDSACRIIRSLQWHTKRDSEQAMAMALIRDARSRVPKLEGTSPGTTSVGCTALLSSFVRPCTHLTPTTYV